MGRPGRRRDHYPRRSRGGPAGEGSGSEQARLPVRRVAARTTKGRHQVSPVPAPTVRASGRLVGLLLRSEGRITGFCCLDSSETYAGNGVRLTPARSGTHRCVSRAAKLHAANVRAERSSGEGWPGSWEWGCRRPGAALCSMRREFLTVTRGRYDASFGRGVTASTNVVRSRASLSGCSHITRWPASG